MFCGAYSGEEDDLSNSKGHRNTQPNLGERLTNISSEIKVKKEKDELGWTCIVCIFFALQRIFDDFNHL